LRVSALANRAALRLGLAAIVLAVEYVALGVLFDGGAIVGSTGWWSRLSNLGEFVRIVATIGTAGLVLEGPSIARSLERAAPKLTSLDRRWGAIHVLAFVVFAAASARVFSGTAPSAAIAVPLLALWLASGGLLVVALVRCTFGSAVRHLHRVARRTVAVGALFGAVAWLPAQQSVALWPGLARWTLATAAGLLGLFSDAVIVDGDKQQLGLDHFQVVIAPACSGIEGIALMLVFTTGYLYRFRATLRFPRALLLLPVAIGAAWLANAVRIAALILIGRWVSADIAYGVFHSKAGWLFFCAIALTIVWIGQRSRFFSHQPSTLSAQESENPAAAYCMPLLALLGFGMLTSAFSGTLDLLYPVRVLGALAAFWSFRGYYRDHERRVSAPAVLMGVAVFAVWWLLAPASDAAHNAAVSGALNELGSATRLTWLALRVFGCVVVVPLAEEFAFRGYLQRRLLAEDFTAISLRKFGWLSWFATSLAFGSLHSSWLAGALAGAAYSLAVYHRGRLADGVVAHATTNALLAGWVLAFGRWDLW
jgi:exosortase E/protease (VPEID-CTERM system)